MYICKYLCMYVCMYVGVHVYICTYVHFCVCSMYNYVHVYVLCTYVCMCVNTVAIDIFTCIKHGLLNVG